MNENNQRHINVQMRETKSKSIDIELMFARPCLLYSVKADAPYFTICLQRMQDPELNFFLQTTD